MKLITTLLLSTSLCVSAVEQDKLLHAGVSTVIGGVAYTYTESWLLSMSGCMTVGVVKEVYDEIDYGGFDHKDLIADGVGCLFGTFVSDTFIVTSDGDEMVINYKVSF